MSRWDNSNKFKDNGITPMLYQLCDAIYKYEGREGIIKTLAEVREKGITISLENLYVSGRGYDIAKKLSDVLENLPIRTVYGYRGSFISRLEVIKEEKRISAAPYPYPVKEKLTPGQQAMLDASDALFNAELLAFKEKSIKGLMHLGRPLALLRTIGVNAEEITLSPKILNRHLNTHGLSVDDLQGLARAIQTPILAYNHGLESMNKVLVSDIFVKGGKLSVSLQLDDNGKVVELNNVKSIHQKEAIKEIERLNYVGEDLRKLLLWVEKEKVMDWFSPVDLFSPIQASNPKLLSVAKILKDFENPKIVEEKTDVLEEISTKEDFSACWMARPAKEVPRYTVRKKSVIIEDQIVTVMNKNIPQYYPSPEELGEKISRLVRDFLSENKLSTAAIMPFSFEHTSFNQVRVINTPWPGCDVGFMNKDDDHSPAVALSTMVNDAKRNDTSVLKEVYDACRTLHLARRIMSTVGRHVFVKGESVFSIHKDLHGRYKVTDTGRERSLRHPFGKDYVVLQDLRYSDKSPLKIYPKDMEDVTIAVLPRHAKQNTTIEDVNKTLELFPLKDYDIHLLDPLYFSAAHFNQAEMAQSSANHIEQIGIRNGHVTTVRLDTDQDIECLTPACQQRIADAIDAIIGHLNQFCFDKAQDMERERLMEKSRGIQDSLAKAIGSEKGRTFVLEKGIPLDDRIVVDPIGDMVVNQVDYLGINASGHAVFTVSDGTREITFSRMMLWNQEQVAEAVREHISKQIPVGEAKISALMDELLTDKIDLHHGFGVEKKLHDGHFGEKATAVIRKEGILYLSDDRNQTLPVSVLKEEWLMNDLVNMTYQKPLMELLRDGEKIDVDIVVDNKLSSGYAIDEYCLSRISRHGDMLRVDGQRNMITQSDMEKGETYLNTEHEMTPINREYLPAGCSYAVYEQLKPLIEEKRREEGTYDHIDYDGQTWPVRLITLPHTGDEVQVGTVALQQALLPDGGHGLWKDDDALTIDEQIIYYVKQDEISLPSKDLAALVEREALDIDHDEEQQIQDAIVERILNPSSDATFTKEQQDMIISYLKDYPTVEGKLRALSPLWQNAEQDSRVKGEPKEWFEPAKVELYDLVDGIRRETGEGLKLK